MKPVTTMVIDGEILICPWCPGFDPRQSRGASHVMCAACKAKLDAAIAAKEQARAKTQ